MTDKRNKNKGEERLRELRTELQEVKTQIAIKETEQEKSKDYIKKTFKVVRMEKIKDRLKTLKEKVLSLENRKENLIVKAQTILEKFDEE